MTEEDIQVTVPEDDEVLEVSVDEPGGSGGGGVTEEVDPTVPAWAKQPQKPTYTAEEVGAQPKGDYVLRDELPESGIPIPETAEVGQTIVVKAVDENGKPTEWEATDFPSGGAGDGEKPWHLIVDRVTIEDVSILEETFDEVSEIRVMFFCKLSAGSDTSKKTAFLLNGLNVGEFSFYNNNYRGHCAHVKYTGSGTYGWRTTSNGEFGAYVSNRMHESKASTLLASSNTDTGARSVRINPFDSNTVYLSGARLIIHGR